MLDASANRAAEGLRTLEEIARFVLNDSASSAVAKTLRHDLVASMTQLPRDRLLAARDTAADVGTQLATPAESQRPHLASIVAAAAARTQQSLRVIEELTKLQHPGSSAAIENIRYRLYDLSAAIELRLTCDRRRRLSKSSVYALLGIPHDLETTLAHVRRLVDAGIDIIQLRHRGLDDRRLYEAAVSIRRVLEATGVLFIVNDRVDLAVAADADGLHVGQDELPPAAARRVLGHDRLIGLSTHDSDQVTAAQADASVDYIGCGPIFPSQTKSFSRYTGTTWLSGVADHCTKPAFAIGGIDTENVSAIAAAGIHRVAITAAASDTEGLESRIASLRATLG